MKNDRFYKFGCGLLCQMKYWWLYEAAKPSESLSCLEVKIQTKFIKNDKNHVK